MDKKRIWYFDFLKIIGSIAVVLIHVISEYWYNLDVSSTNFKLLTILDACCRFCVPIYFMISGSLLLNEDKKITIKDLFKKQILKIFIIYFFWNITYSLLDIVFISNSSITMKNVYDTLINTVLGKGIYHLNFLTIILGFYLCVPALRLITKKENKKILEYLIILLFIFLSINRIIGTIYLANLRYPLLFTGFILYFILGYYLNTFIINKKNNNILYIIGMISLLFTIISSIYYSIELNSPSEVFFDYLSPNVLLCSCSLFVLCKNKFRVKHEKTLLSLGKLYFGVYLIHGLILGFYLKLGLFNINLPLIIKIIMGTMVVYITSVIICYIISKIPIIKKIIYL